MQRNDIAACDHVCPGIRIHAIDIVQPPGIGISPIGMDVPRQIVAATATVNKAAHTPGNQ
jgi:hypothetical protein